MSYTLLDGKSLSSRIKNEIKEEVKLLDKKPTLATILITDDDGSNVYMRNTKIACDFVDIRLLTYTLPNDTTEEELLNLLDILNKSHEVNGILINLPLPTHINELNILSKIAKEKDLDCFNPYNIGLMSIGEDALRPCTPLGIIELMKSYNIDLSGKNCVIINRSNIIGKPLSTLLLSENATVTICHSYTKNLEHITKTKDIIIVAVGKPEFLKEHMVKENAIVIDVGIHIGSDKKLLGDADFHNIKEKTSFITPVPGGVGSMTIAMLLKNCLKAYKMQNNLN